MRLSRDKKERLRRMRTVREVEPSSSGNDELEVAAVERRRGLCGPNNDRIRTGVDALTPERGNELECITLG
jgi:hypothetical protein